MSSIMKINKIVDSYMNTINPLIKYNISRQYVEIIDDDINVITCIKNTESLLGIKMSVHLDIYDTGDPKIDITYRCDPNSYTYTKEPEHTMFNHMIYDEMNEWLKSVRYNVRMDTLPEVNDRPLVDLCPG